MLLHNLIDALQNEDRLRVVGMHTLVNHLGYLGIVAHQEPRVNRDTVAAHAWAGLEDINTRVHIADADNLIHIHIVVATNPGKFIGKSNVYGSIGVFHYLGHLGGTDVGHHNLTQTERSVILLHFFAYFFTVSTDGAVVVQQLVHHVSRDDAFRGMHEVNVFANLETVILNYRTHIFVNRTWAYRRFYHHRCSIRAHFHHILDCCHYITGIHLL